MIIGVPGEIKNNEYRVGITIAGVSALKDAGHQVLVQRGAGVGSGISDQEYQNAGAELVADAEEIYSRADMIVKIKEPLPEEYSYLRKGQ
ncbi:MAG: alanine dehydrogenase, partial [Halanaerobiales bacterium]